ncbi:MAG: RIP metalloprotease RseP [Bilifractor sp.]
MRYLLGILMLGVVVLFHEFGHYLAALKNGVAVIELSFGFGPRLLSHVSKKSGIRYSWKLIPFGGSCEMLGEYDDEEDGYDEKNVEEDTATRDTGSDTAGKDEKRDAHGDDGEEPAISKDFSENRYDAPVRTGSKGCTFQQAALWRRAIIVAAGPVFNFILALLAAFIIVAATGETRAIVGSVETGSPESEAGLQAGDEIIRFDGHRVLNAEDLYLNLVLYGTSTDTVDVTVRRDGEKINLFYTPETQTRWMLGFHYADASEENGVQITQLQKDSALRDAGAQTGDVINAINGTEITDSEGLQTYLQENPLDGSAVDVTVRRGSRTYTLENVKPRESLSAVNQFSIDWTPEKQNLFGVIKYGFVELGYWISTVWKTLGGLVSGLFTINDFSGPVGIVKMVGDTYAETAQTVSVAAGLLTLLEMLCMISANLGVMNLIPFPALDGGKLLSYLIEAIRHKPVSQKVLYYVEMTGFVLLLAFSAYVTIHDIFRYI